MPRRKAPVTSSSQPTLTFNNRPNKIIKPSSSHTPTGKSLDQKAEKLAKTLDSNSNNNSDVEKKIKKTAAIKLEGTPQPQGRDITPPATLSKDEDVAEALRSTAVVANVADSLPTEADTVEAKALKVSEAQIKTYWKAKEAERKAPRVHQQDLSLYDKILHEFDMSYQFGPASGINRSKRWRRANTLGLDPPIEVLAVLLKEEKNTKSAKAKNLEKSIVDELMGSTDVEVTA